MKTQQSNGPSFTLTQKNSKEYDDADSKSYKSENADGESNFNDRQLRLENE